MVREKCNAARASSHAAQMRPLSDGSEPKAVRITHALPPLSRMRYASPSMSDSRVHLPVLGQPEPAAEAPEPGARRRHPEWIRAQLPTKPAFFELRAMVKELALHTVCESA